MTSSTIVELTGSQTPRLASTPPFFRCTLGQDAVDLAAHAGLLLDPWEADTLRDSLNKRREGRWAALEVGLVVPRQNGKGPHSLDTEVLTTTGWTTIGKIAPGAEVYGGDGEPTRVVACSEVFPDEPCFEVEFTDGARHVVASSHLWRVKRKDDARGWRDVQTKVLYGSIGGRRTGNGRMEFNWRVRCDTVVNTPHADLPIDPYLLGYWLGDGNSRAAAITVGAQDFEWTKARIEAAGARVIRVSEHDHGHAWGLHFRLDARVRDGFESRCRRLGVWGNKHIPSVYLTASVTQRRALLAGLMDSDGSIAVTSRSPQVEFTASHEGLAADFGLLARSLGIRVTPRVGASSLNGRTYKPRHRFLWTPTFDPFEMPRKSARFVPPSSRRHELMSITAVHPVPSVPTRCIQVASADGVYLVGRLFTPTHNSIIEARQLAALFLCRDKQTIYSAHQFRTAKSMYRRLRDLIYQTPDLHKMVLNYRQSSEETGVELKTGEKLNYFSRSSGSGRGFTGDTMFFDEAFDLDPDLISDMLPLLSAVKNPQVWYVSSAGMEASEQLAAVRARGLRGDEPRLMYREWSAPDDADTDDVDAWLIANPGIGYRLDLEYIQLVERASMTEDAFRRERLGIWKPPETVEVVIPTADWAVLLDAAPVLSGPVALAVDVTPDRRWCSIAAASLTESGAAHLEIGFHEAPSAAVIALLVALVARWDPCAVVIDKLSPAASLIPGLEAAGIEAEQTGAQEMAAACGGLYDAVAERSISHTGDPLLIASLASAVKREMPSGAWAWNRRGNTPISPLVAVTLARWGLMTFGVTVKPKPAAPQFTTKAGPVTAGLMTAGF